MVHAEARPAGLGQAGRQAGGQAGGGLMVHPEAGAGRRELGEAGRRSWEEPGGHLVNRDCGFSKPELWI